MPGGVYLSRECYNLSTKTHQVGNIIIVCTNILIIIKTLKGSGPHKKNLFIFRELSTNQFSSKKSGWCVWFSRKWGYPLRLRFQKLPYPKSHPLWIPCGIFKIFCVPLAIYFKGVKVNRNYYYYYHYINVKAQLLLSLLYWCFGMVLDNGIVNRILMFRKHVLEN